MRVERGELENGAAVAERFVVERQVCRVCDGVLCAAWDPVTDQRVALKLSDSVSLDPQALRFDREAAALAGLRHPGVARYVAHGRTPEGRLFLATEWVAGESLAQRLIGSGLHPAQALTLLSGVAQALAALHRHGMVHQRLRPSRILLGDGQLDKPVLVGFGFVPTPEQDWLDDARALYYLSPEQALGEPCVGPSSDIFALGSVIVECLTGVAPFRGDHVAVVLTRILYEDVAGLKRLCPDLPPALERLLATQMLAKEPRNRIADGTALVDALGALSRSASRVERVVQGGGTTELPAPQQQLVSVVVARSVNARWLDGGAVARTELACLLEPLGARVARLADGTIVATVVDGRHTARDQAQLAARCALVLKESSVAGAVVLTTGRALVSGQQPMGEAVTRAVRLLGQCPDNDQRVRLDELTAGLLDPLFDVRTEGQEWILYGEKSRVDPTRLLLGKPTPCVGREAELRLLDAMLASCIDDSHVQALLLLGASGLGKSRLRHEFMRRLGARVQPLTVLLGEAEVMHEGAVYFPVQRALRRLCEVDPCDAPEARRRLRERVSQNLNDTQTAAQRVVEFLGELCGVRFPDEASPRLRAARQDPRVMNEQIMLAFVDFLRAECHQRPVVLILEDLHWGDAATIRLIDTALRALVDEPLFVLALARPEVKDLFPQLWPGCNLQELRLGGLSAKASGHLVRAVLGSETADDTVARIAHQAGGNALFLEELIRAAAAKQDSAVILSETVLAMLQSRFEQLEAGARHVLGVASVFGERFDRAGLQALLGAAGGEPHALDRWLEMLEENETIVRHSPARPGGAGAAQYTFRHGLLRDAAYTLLGDEERRSWHGLAGAYLEQTGQGDPGVLAEHYRRGGALAQAATCYAQAAAHALEASDLAGALRAVEQGIACGAQGEVYGCLLAVEGWACYWSWEHVRCYTASRKALSLLVRGSAPWYQALGSALGTAGVLGHHERFGELLGLLNTTPPLSGQEYAIAEPASSAVVMTCLGGIRAAAAGTLAQLHAVCTQLGPQEARAHGLMQLAASWFELILGGNPARAQQAAQAGEEALRLAGDARYAVCCTGLIGFAAAFLGDRALTVSAFRQAMAEAIALKEPMIISGTQAQFAYALATLGAAAEHAAEIDALAKASVAQSRAPNFWEAIAHLSLARLACAQGKLEDAEQAARRAVEVCVAAPSTWPAAYAMLARVLLARGQIGLATAAAAAGRARLGEIGNSALGDISLYLWAARCAEAAGEREPARALLTEALDRMHRQSAPLRGVARDHYLTSVPDHRDVLALARAWGLPHDLPSAVPPAGSQP